MSPLHGRPCYKHQIFGRIARTLLWRTTFESSSLAAWDLPIAFTLPYIWALGIISQSLGCFSSPYISDQGAKCKKEQKKKKIYIYIYIYITGDMATGGLGGPLPEQSHIRDPGWPFLWFVQVRGTWYQVVPGSWNHVPGTRCLVPGTWYLVPGSWYLVPGSWYLIPGTELTDKNTLWLEQGCHRSYGPI